MKKLTIVFIFFLLSQGSLSQEIEIKSTREKNKDKPLMFDKDSSHYEIRPDFFNKVFSFELGQNVEIEVTSKMIFRGKVNSLIFNSDFDLVSITSNEINDLRLIVSRPHHSPIGIEYVGFVMGLNYKDLLKLEKNKESGKYQWTKKEMSEIIPD